MRKCLSISILFFILIILSSCTNQQDTVAPPPNSLEYLVPDKVSLGIKEGDVVDICGEGIRQETESDVICIYPSDGSYNPIQFLQAGQNYNDINFSGLDFRIAYEFGKNNQLHTIMYNYDVSELSSEEASRFFPEMQNVLIAHFGEPIDTADKWVNERYADDPTMLRTAIDNKEYMQVSLWAVDDYWIVFDINQNIICYTIDESEILIAKNQIAKLK